MALHLYQRAIHSEPMKTGRLSYSLSLIVALTIIAAPFWWAQVWLWWTGPMAPLCFAVLGIWLGLYLTFQLKKEQQQVSVLGLWLPLLLITLAHSAALLSWGSSQVRQQAALSLGQQRFVAPLKACIHDPDQPTMETCCLALEALGESHQEVYARWMLKHPTLNSQCLVRAIDGQSLAANSYARGLAQRWEAELIEAAPTQDKAQHDHLCARASNLRHLDRVPNAFIGASLLRCTLAASTPQARYCCGQQLHQLHPDIAKALPDPAQLAQTAFSGALPSLLDASLPHDPAQDRSDHTLEVLALNGPTLQHWSIAAACHAATAGQSPLRQQLMTRYQIALSHTPQCTLTPEQLSALPQHLDNACARWLEAPQDEQPALSLCNIVAQELREDLLHRANHATRLAHHRAYSPFWQPTDPATRAVLKRHRFAPGIKTVSPTEPFTDSARQRTHDLVMRMFGNDHSQLTEQIHKIHRPR